MTEQTVFLFPTKDGYQFCPPDASYRAEILSMLSVEQGDHLDQESISPFVSARWFGESRFLPKCKAIFIVGLMTTGIRNDIHRGSYSMWVAATVVKRIKSFSEQEAASCLNKLYTDFFNAVRSNAPSSAILDALNKYVIPYTGRQKIEDALKGLPTKLKDRKILAGVSAL